MKKKGESKGSQREGPGLSYMGPVGFGENLVRYLDVIASVMETVGVSPEGQFIEKSVKPQEDA